MIFEIWRSIKKSMEKCTFATLFTTSFISLDLLGFKDFKTLNVIYRTNPYGFVTPAQCLKARPYAKAVPG